MNVPKIGVPGIKGQGSSSSSSEDDRRGVKLSKPDVNVPKIGLSKPDVKLPTGKDVGEAKLPSAKVNVPKIGVPGVKGGDSSSSSSEDNRKGFNV